MECPKLNMPRSDSGVGEHVTVDISEGDRYVETDPKKDKHFTKGRSGGNENARGIFFALQILFKSELSKPEKEEVL